MRFIFVSDLHSNKALYNALENLIFSSKPDALIIGGDIFAYSPNAQPQLEFAKEYLCEFIKKLEHQYISYMEILISLYRSIILIKCKIMDCLTFLILKEQQ